jgi:hypothetical protein
LRKNNFEGFTNMSENFQHMDKSRWATKFFFLNFWEPSTQI